MSSGATVVDGDVVASGRALRPELRTALLTAGLFAGAGLVVGLRADVWALSPGHADLGGWWIVIVAVLVMAAEALAFDLEFRRERYTFTFSEIPLVIALFFAAPAHLLIGRFVGAAILLAVKERQGPRKLLLNLASFSAECVVLVAVFQLVSGVRGIEDPTAWPLALLAVAAADLVGFVVVAKVVRWHGGPLVLRSILPIGAVTAPVNTSLALATGLLYLASPWATLLLFGVAGFLVLSYKSYSSLSQRYESLSTLYDFTRIVSAAQTVDQVLEAVLVQAKDQMRAERAELWVIDEADHVVGLAVDDDRHHRIDVSASDAQRIREWFRTSDTAIVVPKGATDQRSREIAAIFAAADCIVAPVIDGGEVVGVLTVVNRLGEMNGFSTREVPMFATLAHHASVALENGRLLVRLHEQQRKREHDSMHDALTGLANRVRFDHILREHLEQRSDGGADVRSAVVVIDLDGFKEVNDTLGHHAGDRVLVEVTSRLVELMGPDVAIARLGGDEFALLLPGVSSREDIEARLRCIRRAVSQPAHIDGLRINVGASMGVALVPDHGDESALLMQRADVAMYGAKAGLGDGVQFYDPDSDTNSTRRLTLANDLHEAIERGEMFLNYQPKVRLADGRLTGFEALLRWIHPTLGFVPPDEFIVLAERTGSIQGITKFVLRTALAQAAEWQRGGSRWGMSINLSTRNLLDDELATFVGEIMHETGADPALVTLEITETSVMSDIDRAIAVLTRLADLGVRLSIDDFGTGYSSLAYLQRLPVDEVKIDKSFVFPMATDPSAEAIVRTVLDLARNMGLTVVAEGVEDLATWTRLQELECTTAQGYFLSRPVPSDAVLPWAAELPRRRLEPRRVIEAAA